MVVPFPKPFPPPPTTTLDSKLFSSNNKLISSSSSFCNSIFEICVPDRCPVQPPEREDTHISILRSHCHHHIEKKGHRRDASLVPRSLLADPAKQQSRHRYENHDQNPVIQSFTPSERCISSRSKQQSALCSNNGNYELLRQQFPEERHTERQTQTQRGVILLPFCTWRFN